MFYHLEVKALPSAEFAEILIGDGVPSEMLWDSGHSGPHSPNMQIEHGATCNSTS